MTEQELLVKVIVLEKQLKDLSEIVITVDDFKFLSKAWSDEAREAAAEARRLGNPSAVASAAREASLVAGRSRTADVAPVRLDRTQNGKVFKDYIPVAQVGDRTFNVSSKGVEKFVLLNTNIGALEARIGNNEIKMGASKNPEHIIRIKAYNSALKSVKNEMVNQRDALS